MEEHSEHPICRATIRDGAVTLNAWQPWLICGGPARASIEPLAQRGVTLADLTPFEGEDGNELLVQFVPWETGGPDAEATLEAWAAPLGYRRIWFPERVVEPEAEPTLARASVTCPVCTCEWSDSGPDFWAAVREQGWFPTSCFGCGASLPEWSVEPCERAVWRVPRDGYGPADHHPTEEPRGRADSP